MRTAADTSPTFRGRIDPIDKPAAGHQAGAAAGHSGAA